MAGIIGSIHMCQFIPIIQLTNVAIVAAMQIFYVYVQTSTTDLLHCTLMDFSMLRALKNCIKKDVNTNNYSVNLGGIHTMHLYVNYCRLICILIHIGHFIFSCLMNIL